MAKVTLLDDKLFSMNATLTYSNRNAHISSQITSVYWQALGFSYHILHGSSNVQCTDAISDITKCIIPLVIFFPMVMRTAILYDRALLYVITHMRIIDLF